MLEKRERTYVCLLLSIVFYTDGWALTSPISHYHQTSSPLGVLRAIPDRNWNDNREQKFLRIRHRNARGSRRILELQTAVVTMSKTLPNGKTSVIDLHSMLHFGDEQYFSFYSNYDYFKYNKVFYELLVSEDFLETNSDGSQSLKPADGKNPICPPPSDKNTANSYGLTCQLDVIDYTKKNWIHCDVTREEYQDIISASSGSPDEPLSIWALASTATAPISQYTSALVRPFTPSTVGSELLQFSSMRLFTNLFLEGSALATFFRLLLWTFSPSPEVSILLLDWSSLVEPKPTGLGFSTVFIPVLESLVTGHISEARRLVFAQLLVSSQTSGSRDENIVKRRNTIALQKLKTYLSQDDETVAILYGAMHCPELQSSLQRMGYSFVSKDWRTAWSVSVPVFGTDTPDLKPGRKTYGGKLWGSLAINADPKEIGIGLVLVPLYLIVGGCDWLGTCKEVAHSLDHGTLVDALLLAFFYLMRHIALYLGLAKFAVNWDGDKSLFEAEE